MGLKRRLILLNAATIVIPVLITIVASFVFIFVSSTAFGKDISYENVKKLTSLHYELFMADGSVLQKNPDRLLEKEFQQYLAARFGSIHADIVVLKKHETLFYTRKVSKIDIEKCLEAGKESFLNSSVDLDDGPFIVKVFPLTFKDGAEGKAILLAPLGKSGLAPDKFLLFALAVFLLSFTVTIILLSLSFSVKILNPLERLQTAAGEISLGNLDHAVIESGDDEIKDLCRSFEQMRLKLKESVHTQMKYEDNRKMLVSSISHDLKTPITSIKGYVEGIMDGVANTPEKTDKYLKTVYSKAIQVDAMIDDLLLYSKLDLNQLPFNFEITDMVQYFEDCIAESEPELEKSGIKIRLKNELGKHRQAAIDRDRIKRVVMNIIDNSRKYMDKPQGEIVITLRETEPSIIIEIQDNGSGIAKDDLRYVFDRFYRADAARSKKSGSGLGLAIAKQIIEGHDGKIWVRSLENKGTSIMMSLRKVQ